MLTFSEKKTIDMLSEACHVVTVPS